MKILVTSFTPFDHQSTNTSSDILKLIPTQIQDTTIITLELPTSFKQNSQQIEQAIASNLPDVVINLGQAHGRNSITPELVAINRDDARIPDNDGFQPDDMPIQSNGENAYFASLPIKAIVQNIKQVGLPSQVSTTAGTYVCNHIMYEVQYLIAHHYPNIKAGFIHVPSNPHHVDPNHPVPTMELDDEVKGILIALTTIIDDIN
ncbi:pyroglutamyl-peptidase I [Lactobacillaceae bacterium Melli_B4]